MHNDLNRVCIMQISIWQRPSWFPLGAMHYKILNCINHTTPITLWQLTMHHNISLPLPAWSYAVEVQRILEQVRRWNLRWASIPSWNPSPYLPDSVSNQSVRTPRVLSTHVWSTRCNNIVRILWRRMGEHWRGGYPSFPNQTTTPHLEPICMVHKTMTEIQRWNSSQSKSN